MSENINSKDFIIGSLIGVFVGATTALLLAPKTGKELRGEIGQQASVVKEKTANISNVVTEQSAQLMNKVKDLRNTSSDVDPLTEVNEIESAMDELEKETSLTNEDERSIESQESEVVLQEQK